MGKKVIVNEEDENSNGLMILFFIIIAIVIGSLSFIAGIVYTSYLDGKDDEACEDVVPIEKIVDEKTINDYVVTDENVIKILNDKVEDIDFSQSVSKEKYLYNYLEDDKYYYVLISYGSFDVDGAKKIVYTDLEKKSVYKEYDSKESFVIDENNYNDFSKYRITFIKDGNDCIFKGAERIE